MERGQRPLGNGYYSRPVELNCPFESACETCSFFATGPEVAPVLLRQRDHVKERDRARLAPVYTGLLDRIISNETPPVANRRRLLPALCSPESPQSVSHVDHSV